MVHQVVGRHRSKDRRAKELGFAWIHLFLVHVQRSARALSLGAGQRCLAWLS